MTSGSSEQPIPVQTLTPPACEVVVVGAGPVGLSLALGLARQGRDVLVLEKDPSTAEHSRAPAIWPATQEILAELGLINSFLKAGIVHRRVELRDVDRETTLLSLPLEELADQTPFPQLLILPQSRTEALLLEALRKEPTAEVRLSCRVTRLVQQPSRVEIRFQESGRDNRVDALYVAGCDGAHSTVRESINAALEGETYPIRAALADVRLDAGPEPHSPRLTTASDLAIGIRIGERLWRLILPFRESEQRPLQQRVDEAARGLFNHRGWQSVWQSEFRLHHRISSRFFDGRIVLAGDAAHLNSPLGGQGMNAGIRDAALLVPVMQEALERPRDDPFRELGVARRKAIRSGVNRFTDRLTRLLLSGQGRALRPALRLVSLLLRIPPLRRRFLKRLAMLP